MSMQEEYVEKKRKQLDLWSAEMDLMEADARRLKERSLLKYQEKLMRLRAKRAEGIKRLENIEAMKGGWERLKGDTETLWSALRDSLREFKTHFKGPGKPEAGTK